MENISSQQTVQEWVLGIKDSAVQNGILSILRGSDIELDQLKSVTRQLRYLIVNPFVNDDKYMDKKIMSIDNMVHSINYYGNIYNPHWVEHIGFAIKLISKFHPSPYTRSYYKEVQKKLIKVSKKDMYYYRMFKEQHELQIKINNLQNWMNDHPDSVLPDQQEQLDIMLNYNKILIERINKIDIGV